MHLETFCVDSQVKSIDHSRAISQFKTPAAGSLPVGNIEAKGQKKVSDKITNNDHPGVLNISIFFNKV